MQQGVGGPCRRLVRVADIARIRNLQAVGPMPGRRSGRCGCGHSRRRASGRFSACGRRCIDCPRCPRRDACAPRSLLRAAHSASSGRGNPGIGCWPVSAGGLVVGTVRIVASETRDAVRVHQAGDKIVSLHAVLVRRAIREMREGSFAELVIFQLPKIAQIQTHIITRPASRSIFRRSDSSAAVPANDIGCRCRWHAHNRGAPDSQWFPVTGLCNMLAAGAVASFAPDVPFRRPSWSRCRNSRNGSRRRAGRSAAVQLSGG